MEGGLRKEIEDGFSGFHRFAVPECHGLWNPPDKSWQAERKLNQSKSECN